MQGKFAEPNKVMGSRLARISEAKQYAKM